MKLDFLTADKLFVDKANMRHGRKTPDVSDILPSVRKRGILQTLIVRASDADGRFGIVAGSRRFRAGTIVAEERLAEGGDAGPVEPFLFPCAILEAGDDAAAIEASLIENMARLDPDEVSRWETFVRLVREGQSVEEIADTFALPALAVRRTLALGNLLPRIRQLYRSEQIDAATVRQLTLASKARQRDWLALWDDPDARCPTGWQLKAWLFGGTAISAAHALFDIEASGLATVADLFGEDRYFADTDAFWVAQNEAVEARKAAYLDAGWSAVAIVSPGESFHAWEYERRAKRRGGRVYIDVRANGEVIFHEGYVSRKEAARVAHGASEDAPKPVRGEVSAGLQAYVDLHRHAAVRAALLDSPRVALRLMVAHAIAGSHLFNVHPEPQAARSDAIRASLEQCRAEAVFGERRGAVLALLGLDAEAPSVIDSHDADGVVGLFLRLLDLPDPAVLEVAAVVMGEALASGSAAVEAAGLHLGVAMHDWWQADPAFFDLVRDRQVLTAMMADVAGEAVASANAKETGKTMKSIIADHLAGVGGRPKVETWVPRWMAFPPAHYTVRGGAGSVAAYARVEAAIRNREMAQEAPEQLAA